MIGFDLHTVIENTAYWLGYVALILLFLLVIAGCLLGLLLIGVAFYERVYKKVDLYTRVLIIAKLVSDKVGIDKIRKTFKDEEGNTWKLVKVIDKKEA